MSAGPAVSAADGAQLADAETNVPPTAQLEHELPLNLYVDVGHVAQLAEPADEVVPAVQSVQKALGVPEFATVPK